MSSIDDMNSEILMLEAFIPDEEMAKHLAGTLKIALDGLAKFFENFPEISEIFGEQALRNEISGIVIGPLTTAFQIGYEKRKTEEQTE